MADLSIDQKLLLEEWKEARSSVARFDENLVNLRKFGFTLATLLLSADAYLSMTGVLSTKPLAIFAATVVVIVLIFALFLLDQHIRALQLAAIERAIKIEQEDELKILELSESLRIVSKKWQTTHGGTPVYVLFLIVTGFLGVVALYQYQIDQISLIKDAEQPLSLWNEAWAMVQMKAMVGLCSFFCVLTPFYGWVIKRASKLPENVRATPQRIRQLPEYTSRRVKIIRESRARRKKAKESTGD